MTGICIVVTGRSGAGKTLFIKDVVSVKKYNLEYMTSYVTRPPRENDYGYIYLTKEEYATRMRASKLWDHFEYYNEYYGTDVAELIEKAHDGKNIIISCYPTLAELSKIHSMYALPIVSIFIDISRDVSLERIRNERQGSELQRVTEEDAIINDEVVHVFDHRFVPEGNFERDTFLFRQLVQKILM